MDKQTHPPHVKKAQQRNLLVLGLILLAGCLALYFALAERQPPAPAAAHGATVDFATPLSQVDAQSLWLERAQNQLAQATKAQNALEQQLQGLQHSNDAQDKDKQQLRQQVQALQTQVSTLQQQMTQRQAFSIKGNGGQTNGNELAPAGSVDNASEDFINALHLPLTPRPVDYTLVPAKNPDTFVPAGTFVRAITLGGADAAAGVTSQADPSPMLFRILDDGTLPNHRQSHLKNCMATAAAYGDISAKRGQIRLERLSCVQANGQVLEMPVEATVFGPDGKNGVRGHDYWGESALLGRAFAAGTLAGLSSGIAQSYTTNALTPYGQVQTVNNGRIMQYGLASGVGNAAEKLADYNIKRAEQFHPVIQLSAGTVVDIVFLKGFYLDNKPHHDGDNDPDQLLTSNPVLTHTPEIGTSVSATATASTDNTLPSLPLTPQQIQALKQVNNQAITQ